MECWGGLEGSLEVSEKIEGQEGAEGKRWETSGER